MVTLGVFDSIWPLELLGPMRAPAAGKAKSNIPALMTCATPPMTLLSFEHAFAHAVREPPDPTNH